jgi:hypothetical protein
MSASDIPSGSVADDDYKSRTGQSEIPVQSDSAAIEATEYDDGGDSEQQLGQTSPPPYLYPTNSQQKRTRTKPLTRATSSTSGLVGLRRRRELTLSRAMMWMI